ncbi:Protein kinase domain [Phytophthora infestans]|uniref:Protein kinase domain n=2 Tax=Phytophthora infestans TaxID=4787 RepID=A0A833SHR4_PHYIN|nr:Protein kinase domain [Phytophthora infestans]KAF4149170.1 Protein kinase domain [Phytophthora infestans]
MEAPDDKENQPPESTIESLKKELPLPTMRYTDRYTPGKPMQILHFGENARSLFMLDKPSEKRLRLVIALKKAPLSVDAWLELMRYPLTGNSAKYNKIRLLKRALTCVDSLEARQTAGYTEMCIMLAKLSDTEAGVRQHFHEMKKRRVGEKQPLLYEEEAAFEYAAGNKDAAEEVLERGVDNDALTPAQKEQLLKKITAGRAGWVAAFSGSPQEQKVLALRTLRRTQESNAEDTLRTHSSGATTPRVTTPLHLSIIPEETTPISRGRDGPVVASLRTATTPSNATPVVGSARAVATPSNATPLSQTRNGAGFSTASKAPHSSNKSPLLTTPSIPTRPSLKTQSTSRKIHHSQLRFQLGGPALRVAASNANESNDDDDDDDDAMMGSQATPTKRVASKAITPINTTANPASSFPTITTETKKKPKINVGDINHILQWDPEKEKLWKKKTPQTTSTGDKDIKVSMDAPAKPTAMNVTFKTSVEEMPPEKATMTVVELPSKASAGVELPSKARTEGELRPESRDVSPVPTSTSMTGSKSSAPETRSPRVHRPFPWEIKANTARADPQVRSSTTPRAVDFYRSPKRQQLDPAVSSATNYADSSSPSSVSSSSSPPVASMDSASSRDALESLTSKVVVNGQKYIKLEQIGSGGSSKVFRMLGPDLKIYALKKIKLKKLDAQSIAQFTNEIELLKRLQGSPYIIRLITAEQDLQQRQINVIMEHGEIDLSNRLQHLKGGMDENMVRVIWTQMLQAVDAIHQKRIIHGDLKPANFLFVNGALKLIDFGIAKTISNDTTNIERDSQIGTVNFMSPEAIQGNSLPNGQRDPRGKMKVGRASDIWSLGCILYQIVYSKPPFGDVHNIIEKFRCIIDPTVPINFPPLKNKDLEDVIRSCLQRDHRLRPPIEGENGLLQHPFLRSGGSSAVVSPTTTVTMTNAPEILSQLGDLLRSQGVATSRVNMFMTIGQDGLRNAGIGVSQSGVSQAPSYFNNTQERRTDI